MLSDLERKEHYMAKGMRVKLNYHVSHDPDTGAEVTRLTPPEVTCHRNYFYQK